MAFRFIDDGFKTFLATHLENFAKLPVQFMALTFLQINPSRKQGVRLAIGHADKIERLQQVPFLKKNAPATHSASAEKKSLVV